MTSFSETSSFNPEGQKRAQETGEKKFIDTGEQVQTAKNANLARVERNENAQDSQNIKPRKNHEICGVHTARTSEKKFFQNNAFDVDFDGKQSNLKNSERVTQDVFLSPKDDIINFKTAPKEQEIEKGQDVTEKLKREVQVSKETKKTQENNANNETNAESNSQNTDLNVSNFENGLRNSAKDTEEKKSLEKCNSDAIIASDNLMETSDDKLHRNKIEAEKHDPIKAESSSPLPDILSTLHKTVSSMPKTTINEISSSNDIPLFDKTTSSNEKFSKSKMILSQSPYISHSLNSDSSSHDTEAELKRLTNLQSLRANQSIYKLAYDESITDQSEADSRSPSPVDPESQVPRSIITDEILIHEADSCSDAGSEDVELIPHRYESETFLNESKHMYVNKLSLAVELLRTQESLPYDDQFRRVSGESNLNLKETNPDAIGEVNLGFIEDSSSFESSEGPIDNRITDAYHNVITSQLETGMNSRNSATVSSFSFEDSCNESCEEAKEVVVEAANNRDNSEGVRTGYRRFQVQFRHYFTPRAALVNPCLCCVIM